LTRKRLNAEYISVFNLFSQGVGSIMKNNIQILPIIASVGIGAAAYSMMTGRGGQLQNMIPLSQLSNMSNMDSMGNQGSNTMTNQQQNP